ncbi:cytochrome P450 52A11 [Metarhizium album ARSEF 1941]|uniref:Cytochrome P450 52A11 n=1 Tax=Metarhizium album (strain ARSEF 1941) TaxID=1081103 RepID=A0A0B2X087_METAS|nr:cytochrome P450 52A11 [Metarhizium album ARSEF 1941]KHN98505.1 cytochrome P450 52A11 [Metarhizium album ARSEF 1941]
MGVLEVVAEQLSAKLIFSFLLFALVLRGLIRRFDQHRRIKHLGNYGKDMGTWVPLGLDIIWTGIRATRMHNSLELWRDQFFKRNKCNTVEARIVTERLIFTIDPENIKALLATQFSDFGKGEPFRREWSEFLGDGIFTTDGAMWHNSRQMLRPQFTRDRVSDLDCFEAHVDTLFRAMANGGALQGENQLVDMNKVNGRVVDIADLFYRYTLDVATDFLLGADVKSMSTPKQPFAEAFNNAQRFQNMASRAGGLRWMIPKWQYRADLRVINTFVGRFIDLALQMAPEELESKSKADKGYTFLHELARFTRDPKVIRDQVIAVLLAGRDTTAATLSWAIYELARHPECFAKMRREIIEVVGPNKPPTYAHLKNMPYMKAVINETLRLYPVVPFNVRLALKDCTLPRGGGPQGTEPLPVLKDTKVAYSTLVMQRRPDLYPPVSETFADPALFSPERWTTWHPQPHQYIPFNAGPRICIGQQFALTEMSYVLVRMLQRFDRLDNHMFALDVNKPVLRADVVLSPGQGVRVAFWEARNAKTE